MHSNPLWYPSYPKDVPYEINPDVYSSIVALMEDSFSRYASRPAFESFGKSITYNELDLASQQFAGFLQFLGIQKGDRVAIMLPNVLQFPIAMAGILRVGAIAVNVNPLYTARELEHQLKDSGAKAIVILENFAHVLEEVLSKVPVEHVVVTTMGELLGVKGKLIDFTVKHVKKMVPTWHLPHYTTFSAAMTAGRKMGFAKPEIGPHDVAFLQYTGGTTGVSKGATLDHRNIVANILQMEAWLKPAIQTKPIDQMVIICALPLYHIFALTCCAMFGIRSGGVNVLIANPKDIPGFIKTLRELQEFHILPGVNTLFNALMQDPDFTKINFSNLRISNGGGMAVQKAVAMRWQELTGVPIMEGYGLSETSPVATCNLTIIEEFTGSVGLPVPNTEISIRNDAGEEVPTNEPGEICIKGPQVMRGYWNRDDETKKVMTSDGFFKSGDIGFINETGFVKIIDRKKDMILVSGFNVYPNEVEDVIALMPQVLECAVIGIPDEQSGETVKAFVVKKDPSLTKEEVLEFCSKQLTNYKRPKQIEFIAALPKSNVGKILRRELRN
jgi:long-chain acyl-CoA synthetase